MDYDNFIKEILEARGNFGIPDSEYKERHHILPKCLGGTDSKENLIDLTASEHYTAHKLLAEKYPENQGLIYAWFMMSHGGGGQKQRPKQSEEEYEEARKAYALYLHQNIVGINNPNYGKTGLIGTANGMFGKNREKENSPWFGKHRDKETMDKFAKANSKRIFQMDLEGNIINVFASASEASKETGVCVTQIKDCANHRFIRGYPCVTAGGFKWKYDEDYIQ